MVMFLSFAAIDVHPYHLLQQTRGNSFNIEMWSYTVKLYRYFWNSIGAKTRLKSVLKR